MRIFLDFTPAQTSVHRARIKYAFRLYCAIYGHQPILQSTEAASADVWISYGSRRDKFPRTVTLGNSYKARDSHEAAPCPKSFATDLEATTLVHGASEGASPDWLGEIFEWVSCADEYSVTSRDSRGRIQFKDTYAGRHGLDIRLPYAAIAMRLLQLEISKLMPTVSKTPTSPAQDGSHFIINTHDVDFLALSRRGSVSRLVRNSAISLLLLRSPKLALEQLWKALLLAAGGTNPLNQTLPLAEYESRRSLTASYFFIPKRKHSKDANYLIDQQEVKELIRFVEHLGMEIGVHGSYTSLDSPDGLMSEFDCLREHGFCPIGERQHWLRFTLDRLIPAMELTKGVYDASVGWSDRIGFRAGACFAFPPYNFAREEPAKFLEMPLAVMDQGLLRAEHKEHDPFEAASELLETSRRYGWGGISLLWHPSAFDGVQLPGQIGKTFGHLVDNRSQWHDTWLSGMDFVTKVHLRYESVGFSLNTTTTLESPSFA